METSCDYDFPDSIAKRSAEAPYADDAHAHPLEQIDDRLDEQTESTLAILRKIQLAQLKATIPRLSLQ